MTRAHEEEVLARIAKGLVRTEPEAAFLASRRLAERPGPLLTDLPSS